MASDRAPLRDLPRVDVGRANERRFKILWWSVLAMMVAGVVTAAFTEYQIALDRASRAVSDSALVVKQHMSRHFESADLIMRFAMAEVQQWEQGGEPGAVPEAHVIAGTGAVAGEHVACGREGRGASRPAPGAMSPRRRS